jgi:hypothetical protein
MQRPRRGPCCKQMTELYAKQETPPSERAAHLSHSPRPGVNPLSSHVFKALLNYAQRYAIDVTMIPDHTVNGQSRFEREMPKEFWRELRKPRPRPTPPAPKQSWAAYLIAALVGACAVGLFQHPATVDSPRVVASAPTPTPTITGTPSPTPVPVQFVPRAQPVEGPLTTAGVPMLSGNQYYLTMPDGRRLLVNYLGSVDHACNLPRQPKGGANNAAYTELATGNTWVYTVPAGVSNVPHWIDP